MTFRDSKEAFERAIKEGRLTSNPKLVHLPNYAGNYMYIGTTDDGRDLFKNIETRKYDV